MWRALYTAAAGMHATSFMVDNISNNLGELEYVRVQEKPWIFRIFFIKRLNQREHRHIRQIYCPRVFR